MAKNKKKAAAGRKGGKSRPSLKQGRFKKKGSTSKSGSPKKGKVPPQFLKNQKKGKR